MDLSWKPIPKPVSKPKEKRPKKKKNPNLYGTRIVPSKKERTRITETAYKRMIKEFGEYCLNCGSNPISAHHIVFRSQMGSGNWRNLAPLCNSCHSLAHKLKTYAEQLREDREAIYGPHFHKDKYSLFKESLINNTTDEAYERFMEEEEKRVKKISN
jgi:hypothetical protein